MSVKPKRLSARLDTIRATFMSTYKKVHSLKKDIDVINEALDALKEKESKQAAKEIRHYENLTFKVIELIAGINSYRDSESDKYLEVMKETIKEIHRVTKDKK